MHVQSVLLMNFRSCTCAPGSPCITILIFICMWQIYTCQEMKWTFSKVHLHGIGITQHLQVLIFHSYDKEKHLGSQCVLSWGFFGSKIERKFNSYPFANSYNLCWTFLGVLCHCSVILNAIQYFSEAMHKHFGAGKGFAKQVSHTANPLVNSFEEN